MSTLLALILAAAAPQVSADAARPAPAVQVSVRASAEIVRAETSSPDPGEGGAKRQVRRRAEGQSAVEFE